MQSSPTRKRLRTTTQRSPFSNAAPARLARSKKELIADTRTALSLCSPSATDAIIASTSSSTPFPSRLSSTRTIPATTTSSAQDEQLDATRKLLSRCLEETVPLLEREAKRWFEDPNTFMNVEQIDVSSKIQHHRAPDNYDRAAGIISAFGCLTQASAHCRMLKLLLAMLFYRLFRNMNFEQDVKQLRAVGHAAHVMSETAGNNSILFLVPFSR